MIWDEFSKHDYYLLVSSFYYTHVVADYLFDQSKVTTGMTDGIPKKWESDSEMLINYYYYLYFLPTVITLRYER